MDLAPITSWQELDARISECGLLPLFDCGIPGYSAAGMTPGALWFSGSEDGLGLWGWKIPVIRERNCAYGMFFAGKKGFVSLDLLPDFLNWRRSRKATRNEDKAAIEDMVLSAIEVSGSATKAELRQGLGIFGRYRRRTAADPANLTAETKLSIDPILSDLQKCGRLIISNISPMNRGYGTDTYGWQTASFDTPENVFGHGISDCGRTPAESQKLLFEHLRRQVPDAPEKRLLALI